jgi:hypothetical protein
MTSSVSSNTKSKKTRRLSLRELADALRGELRVMGRSIAPRWVMLHEMESCMGLTEEAQIAATEAAASNWVVAEGKPVTALA